MAVHFAWLGSLGIVKHGRAVIDPALEAGTPDVRHELSASGCDATAATSPGLHKHLFSLVGFKVSAAYHSLLMLRGHERHQLRFWEQLVGDILGNGAAFVFDIVHLAALPQPCAAQQFSSRKFRGLVNVLEEGQASRLLRTLGAQPSWLPPDSEPTVVVRLPTPYAALITAGKWCSMLLPRLPVGAGHSGTSGYTFQWSLLGVADDMIPGVPDVVLGDTENAAQPSGAPALTPSVASAAADLLRHAFSVGAFADVAEVFVSGCVSALQAFHDDTTVSGLAGTAQNLQGRYHWTDQSRPIGNRVTYQAQYMIRVMLMSSLLRRASVLTDALRTAVSMVRLVGLHAHFHTLIDECTCISPDESTVSRWRVLLDSAIMLHERGRNDAASQEGGTHRYIMADSSVQHQRDFEHIVVSSIRHEDIIGAFGSAKLLGELWRCRAH